MNPTDEQHADDVAADAEIRAAVERLAVVDRLVKKAKTEGFPQDESEIRGWVLWVLAAVHNDRQVSE